MIGEDGNIADRALGEYWEDRFIEIARGYGWRAWAFNRRKGATFTDSIGQSYISPDVWILRRQRQQYICEIKHKDLARNGCYGFELYREESMLAIERDYQNQFGGVLALYVVHNHAMAGGKYVRANNITHWHGARLFAVASAGHEGAPQKTYYNGKLSDHAVRIKYYPYKMFAPVTGFLE